MNVVASYLAVTGEWESGTIRFLLGYPNTRAEVVAGKLLSRLAIVDGAIVGAVLVGVVVALVRFPSVDFGLVAGFLGLTLLFTSAYVAIGVGISAAVASRSRAMAAAVGAYFLFNVEWSVLSPVNVPDILSWALHRVGVELSAEAYQFVYALSPPVAYLNSLQLVSEEFTLGPAAGANAAFLQPWVMVVILVGWIVVPLAAGYLLFRTAQIS